MTVKDIIELFEFYDETASRVLAGHHRQIPTTIPLLKPGICARFMPITSL